MHIFHGKQHLCLFSLNFLKDPNTLSPRSPTNSPGIPKVRRQTQRQSMWSGLSHWGTHKPTVTQPCPDCSLLPVALGWRQQAGPRGCLCVGPGRRLELPTTYFSGQEEPFGVRGLSCGARMIKIKTAWIPGEAWTRGLSALEELAAGRAGRKAGWGLNCPWLISVAHDIRCSFSVVAGPIL